QESPNRPQGPPRIRTATPVTFRRERPPGTRGGQRAVVGSGSPEGYPRVGPGHGADSMPTDTAPSQTPPDAALLPLVFGRCISVALSVVAKLSSSKLPG